MVRHAKNLKLRTARERLAAWVLHQSVQAGGALAFTLRVEKRRLASYFGVTPESLSRTIRALREDGVTVDGARVIITDPAKLRDLAGLDPILDGSDIKDALV